LCVPRGLPRAVGRAVQRTTLHLARLAGREAYTAGDLDLVRPDGVLDRHGTFRLFEVNTGSCVGGLAEIEALSDVFAPWVERTLGPAGLRVTLPRPLAALANALALRFGRGACVAWTALPGALDTDWAPPLVEATIAALTAAGLTAMAAEPRSFDVNPGHVRLGGRPVDVLLRVVDADDWCAAPSLAHLRAAVARGDVALFSSSYDRTIGDKGLLARASLAGDPLVPWTRLARPALEGDVDLLPFVREHAERYVLKPAWGRQGSRVAIGREDVARFGQLLVASVVSGDCVLQEYVEPEHTRLPYASAPFVRSVPVVLSPFLIRGSPASLCARIGTGETQVLTHPALGTTGLLPAAEIA